MNERNGNRSEEYWLAKARAGRIPVHVGIIMDGNGAGPRREGSNDRRGTGPECRPYTGVFLP